MPRPTAPLAALVLAGAFAACGSSSAPSTPSGRHTPSPQPSATESAIAIAPADRPACALLYARLQRVSSALATSSELIAHSLNKRQLSHRIQIEQVQLERSAGLIASGPAPAPVAPATRELAAALRDFSRDFKRARRPAVRGDFQAASDAMTDPPVVNRIIRASKTIEDACK